MRSFSYYTGSRSVPAGHYVDLQTDKFLELVRAAVEQIEVDETWYRTTYQDVNEAIEAGIVISASEHYVKAGYFENRLPRAIRVDERWYLKEYTDVAEAIQEGSFTSATQHFTEAGFKEGRLPRYRWSLILKSSSRQKEFSN